MRNWKQYHREVNPDLCDVWHTASGSVSTDRKVPVHGRRLNGDDAPAWLTRRGRTVLIGGRVLPWGRVASVGHKAPLALLAAFRYEVAS